MALYTPALGDARYAGRGQGRGCCGYRVHDRRRRRRPVRISEALRTKHPVTLAGLAVDAADGAKHARYCELRATFQAPQFQKGKPPFNAGGSLSSSTQRASPESRSGTDDRGDNHVAERKNAKGGYPLSLLSTARAAAAPPLWIAGTWRVTSEPSRAPRRGLRDREGRDPRRPEGPGLPHPEKAGTCARTVRYRDGRRRLAREPRAAARRWRDGLSQPEQRGGRP